MMHRRVITADLPLIGAALALSVFGIAMVYSAGQTDVPTVATRAWVSQIKWLLVALVAAFLVSRASVRLIEWLTWPAFLLTIALLVFTLLFGSGAGTAASVKGWLTLGGVRLGQPAELAKITVVLMLARILGERRDPPRSILELWKPVVALARPETFDDLRALFVGMSLDDLRHGQKERRSPIDRRAPEDRRVFPPRPEGRRRSFGRRATDPRD